MTAWSPIPKPEYDAIWDRFEAKFRFRPSVSDFPAIKEPVPSRTYSIAAAFSDSSPTGYLTEDIDDAALRVCSAIAAPAGRVIALDWQHECYYFDPSCYDGTQRIPFFPDGDYHIFLSEDKNDGWFGHPWEPTICVFGTRAVSILELGLPRLFTSPVRRDGHSSA
jgi:hypothetical protein